MSDAVFYFVLSVFRDNLFTENSFGFFISYFKQVFYVTVRGKKLVLSANIFAAYCRSFTKIRKRRGPSIHPCGTPHVIVSSEIFSSTVGNKLFSII